MLQQMHSTSLKCKSVQRLVHTPVACVVLSALPLKRGLQANKVMIRVREATGVNVSTGQLFNTPCIADLAEAVSRLEASAGSAAIPTAGYDEKQLAAGVPCSPNQEQMLVLYQMQPGSAAYNLQDAMRLRGSIDEAVLEAALAVLVRRHASLRTHFVERDGQLLQAVLPADSALVPRLHRCSLSSLSNGSLDGLVAELWRLAAEPYVLVGGGVPLRIYLLAEPTSADRVLLLCAHHAIRRAPCTGGQISCWQSGNMKWITWKSQPGLH